MTETVEHLEPQPQARAWRRFARNRSAHVGAVVVGAMVLMALLAGVLAPYGPETPASRFDASLRPVSPPSREHWLGTDGYNYDVLTRVMYGARLSLAAGLVSITLAVVIGATAGALSGYFGGWLDATIMRTIDVALAFPSILIALLVAMALQPGWIAVMIAVGLINVPAFARQVRATVLTVRSTEYVLAARAMGASPWHILRTAVLPAIVNPVVVLGTLGLGSAILEVAGLAFLGIAGDPTEAEWGSMLAKAKDHISASIWPALGPGVAISLTVLGFNLLGDGLRDALDPRMEGGK
ncbi:MAG: ABC transporter permease [Pirellulaceae bacterium]